MLACPQRVNQVMTLNIQRKLLSLNHNQKLQQNLPSLLAVNQCGLGVNRQEIYHA